MTIILEVLHCVKKNEVFHYVKKIRSMQINHESMKAHFFVTMNQLLARFVKLNRLRIVCVKHDSSQCIVHEKHAVLGVVVDQSTQTDTSAVTHCLSRS